jgi:bacteriocin biosynthesis cyclodehydratase domain-containing protein
MIALTEGRFGAAVGAILARQAGANVHRLLDSRPRLAELVAGAGFVAVALWRLCEAECDELDEICARQRIPWSAAYLQGEMLFCGPVVVPGAGPCFRCFRRRYLTHNPAADRERALLRAYGRDPRLGPEGFVPPVAWLAAAALMEDRQRLGAQAGRVRRIDLCTGGTLVDASVIGVHGCRRCRPSEQDESGARFVRDMVPALGEMLE